MGERVILGSERVKFVGRKINFVGSINNIWDKNESTYQRRKVKKNFDFFEKKTSFLE